MLAPGVEPAILVDRALELVVAGGTVEIVTEIVLPRPLQLDRRLTFRAIATTSHV